MPKTKSVAVKNLKLDLTNFRTVPQANENHAVQAMVAISPDRFWALMESLIDDGYLPTENILVIKAEANPPDMVVKEGNRRIAALKLVHGFLQSNNFTVPENITSKINSLSNTWKTANAQVPCAVYDITEAATVDRIVTLAHGKGEKAGRDRWNAVAGARHNRDRNNASEPGLDLLEKYLSIGMNLTAQQKKRWAGDYPLTVLDEAMPRIASRLGVGNSPGLATKYPSIQHREALEEILKNIGLQNIRFETIRNKTKDFAADYGMPPATSPNNVGNTSSQKGSAGTATGGSGGTANQPQGQQGTTPNTTGSSTQGGAGTGPTGKKTAAVATNDPKAVKRTLRKFKPVGNNRQKVETLRKEALELNMVKNPLAFCFLLRSMFELSAKAYCNDHKASGGPSATKPDGTDRSLVDVLRDITNYMTTLPNQKQDKAVVKALHGAMTELGKPQGILSVTSMNQLIHNPSFSVTASDISTLFGNIFPLLEAMN